MRGSERLMLVLCVASASLALRSARAAEPGSRAERVEASPASEGEALFRRGRLALNAGEFDVARDFFERSFRVDPALGTLLNLAVCEEKLGRLLRARARLEQALAVANPADKRRAPITQRLSELEQRIPWLDLRLESRPAPGVQIFLDDERIETNALERELRLDPGSHSLRCTGPNLEECSESLELAEGENRRLTLQIRVAPAKIRVASKAPRGTNRVLRAARPSRTLAWVLGGAGIAGVGMSLAGGALVLHEKEEMARHCDSHGCDRAGLDAAARGKFLSVFSTVSAGLGVALLGGATYVLLAPPGPSQGGSIGVVGRFQ